MLININHSIYYGIVAAAGVGQRFSESEPKQYWKIFNKTVLEHTLERFLGLPWLEKIIVPLHPEDHYFSSLSIAKHPKIITVIGGETRALSVALALNALSEAKPNDWILVHDAVRPCIDVKDIERLKAALQEHPVGGALGIPMHDTVKKINENNEIVQTISRDNLVCVQTPQLFRKHLLDAAYAAAKATIQGATDEASLIEQLGHAPKIINGQRSNLKLTQMEDLPLIEIFLKQQMEEKK